MGKITKPGGNYCICNSEFVYVKIDDKKYCLGCRFNLFIKEMQKEEWLN